MFCISLTFRDADVDLREQYSWDEQVPDSLSKGVFLSTCNRVEVYGVGDLYPLVGTWFSGVKSRLALYEGENAVRHLFKVAAGLDSMVLGEDEILGQVKTAFQDAQNAGRTDYELNTIFKSAITAAKRVKTDTKLSKTSVSVATLAASACSQYAEALDGPCKVVIVGASGEIGGKLAKDLLSIGKCQVAATVRKHRVPDDVERINYEDRYSHMAEADIIISATRCPYFTVTADRLAEFPEKKRLYIDLAVPRDIDPALVPVITVDDLRELANKNNEIKQGEVPYAEAILEEELQTLYKDLAFHDLLPLLEKLPEAADNKELRRFFYVFRETATAEELTAFINVMLRMEENQ